MSALKFEVYKARDDKTGANHVETIEFDPQIENAEDVQLIVNRIHDLKKEKQIVVAPNNE